MPDNLTRPVRLMTVDPGHFHAALIQKYSVAGIHPRVHVYAPLDDDLALHIRRLVSFNRRAQHPTAWELDIRSGANYWERFLREQPGNTVVLSGKNKPKIDRMLASVEHGLNVLADKPWIVDASDFPKLERLFHEANLRELFVWDMMTERFEVTNRIQRDLVQTHEIFGDWLPGTAEDPALSMESVHHLKKRVAGGMLNRPPWWFDVLQTGDGLADVGTHLVDLAILLISLGRPVSHESDVCILDANRWPLFVDRHEFAAITGVEQFPDYLHDRWVDGDVLRYYGNGSASFVLRGMHVRMTTLWELEAEPGWSDRYEVVARGSRATIASTHDATFGPARNLFIRPTRSDDFSSILKEVENWCRDFQTDFPGLSVVNLGETIHLHIPDAIRLNHENLFALVIQDYIRYFQNPRTIPSWERPNLLTKYYITTKAVEMARQKSHGA